jgi:predicted lipoprotein with Yx(FWY)xxD motif
MRTKLIAATALGMAVLVAACSGSGATTAPTTAPTAAPTAAPSEAPASAAPSEAPASAAASPAAGGAAGVNLADSKLGKILVAANGMTLYIFTPDGTGGKSTCTDKCLASWPALTSDAAPTLGTGLDAEDFASITRDDNGAKQVTFYGMPLYFFGGDKAAGDTNGQGLFSKWYVIGADGKPIQATSSTGSTY